MKKPRSRAYIPIIVAAALICLDVVAANPAWTKYTSVEGRYSVSLPGVPSALAHAPRTRWSGVGSEDDGLVFRAQYADFPAGALEASSEAYRINCHETDATVIEEKGTTIRGLPGEDCTIEKGDRTIWKRLLIVGDRFYGLSVAAPTGSDAEPVRKFFDSFALTN